MYRAIVLLLLIMFCGSCYYGTGFGEKWNTPKEFVSQTPVPAAVYAKDRRTLLGQLYEYLDAHEKSFHSNEYFDSTIIIIDTILYSPNFNKLATFVITKNPTYRLISPNETYRWYYNAYCYLGMRDSLTDTFNLKWLTKFYGNSQALINNFIRLMRREYGVTVTVVQ